jgi:hypothetical protein
MSLGMPDLPLETAMGNARRARLLALSVITGTALAAGISMPASASVGQLSRDSRAAAAVPFATITTDSSQAPDLAGWLQNQVVPTLQTWYPQIVTILGGTEPGSFKVTISSSYTGVAYTSGASITLGAAYFRGHQSDIGAPVHESVHVAQQARNMSGWAVEGVADWFRYYQYEHIQLSKPSASSSWTNGYRTTAYFFEYIRSHYDAAFVRKLHAAGQAGGPSADTVIQQSTGKTTSAVWSEMQNGGTPNPPPPPAPGGTWTVGTSYAVGATVTYASRSYRCIQAHTALQGWEPPNVPALWQPV